MSQYHRPTSKKVSRGTGGRRRGKQRDKKLSQYGRDPSLTRVSDKDERKKVSGRGLSSKIKLKKSKYANVKTDDGIKKVVILSVLESHTSEHVRRNIITRGAVLTTEIGKAKVSNRVGQDGIVNAVLIEDKPSNSSQ